MSNMGSYAESELEFLCSQAPPDDRPLVEAFKKEIIALIDAVGNSGQSGGSMPYVGSSIINTLKTLLNNEPLMPITGVDEEWVNVCDYFDGEEVYQNKRLGGLFKNGKHGIPWYVDAIIWKEQNGSCFTGSVWKDAEKKEAILSRQYVSLPFKPKSFYVDVTSEEVAKDDWEHYLVNDRQLAKALDYYNPNKGKDESQIAKGVVDRATE